jgi:zinc/manganese transport system substrate-binding protein
MGGSMTRTLLRLLPLPLLLAALIAGCGSAGSSGSPGGTGGRLEVVAAENFWGSLASQLGGDRVHVTSIIHSPATDPHSYEPTPQDGRTMASANLAIVNGIGYDPWAPKLLNANPDSSRLVLTVGDVVGVHAGGNPHRWYSPTNVHQVVDRIVADYKKLDPKSAAYFDQQRAKLLGQGLAQYNGLIAAIRSRYHGVPVGASESIFAPLAQDLGLKLITPPGYLKAISEGTDPTAQDKATTDRQITTRQIKVWVFNSQNATPDIKRLNDEAASRGIPIATVTETLTPATASFQAWQSRQLDRLEAALAKATGR